MKVQDNATTAEKVNIDIATTDAGTAVVATTDADSAVPATTNAGAAVATTTDAGTAVATTTDSGTAVAAAADAATDFHEENAVATDTDPAADANSSAARAHMPYQGWFKKTLLDKLDAVALDYWSGGSVCWWTTLVLVSVSSLYTRLYGISQPHAVVWDETHFGKMLSWYINGTYFFDVHPPGGKLLLALLGWVGGYNGSHPFTSPGLSFEGYHGILFMRAACAVMGAALVPMAFACVWTMTRRLPTSNLAAILALADIGSLTLTKFILLDAPLLFFMMATFLSLCCLDRSSNSKGAFSRTWWASLVATGFFLGCVVSVKFVGLFTVAVVGLYTASQLWQLLALSTTREFLMHLGARGLCLIFIPVAVYLSCFFVHDARLYKTFSSAGSEEAALSPEYQMTLQGNILHNANFSPQVVYGGLITLRNDHLAGPYLHSHNLTYPHTSALSGLQQVTGYRAKDHNNYFRILYPLDDPDSAGQLYTDGPESIRDGDFIRLYHVLTNSTVAVSAQGAYVVSKHKLVYAEPYTLQPPEYSTVNPLLDTSDLHEPPSSHVWQVVMPRLSRGKTEGLQQPNQGPESHGSAILPLATRFSLLNLKFGCVLTWSLEKLDSHWAEGQEEITCSKSTRAQEALWRIETNFNPYSNFSIRASNLVEPLSAWKRLKETHLLMQWTNSHLKPDSKERFSPFYHRPWMWPIVYKSQPWYDVNYRIVLLGNPIVIWLSTGSLLAAVLLLIQRAYHRRRSSCKQLSHRKFALHY
ncbi:Glycosyl transferase family 39/83 [Trinorchestia longiramus]|nr:Glycosyl transferase family 39/83 [Trinorchestia longiramus]